MGQPAARLLGWCCFDSVHAGREVGSDGDDHAVGVDELERRCLGHVEAGEDGLFDGRRIVPSRELDLDWSIPLGLPQRDDDGVTRRSRRRCRWGLGLCNRDAQNTKVRVTQQVSTRKGAVLRRCGVNSLDHSSAAARCDGVKNWNELLGT